MKKFIVLIFLFPVIMYAQTITPIANIQDSINIYNGQSVTIKGIVTIGAGITHGTRLNVFVQDESGRGILLFDYNITSMYQQDLIRGNEIQLTGDVEEYNGITEITDFSYSVLQQGLQIPIIPLTLPEAQDHAYWEGTMVSVSGTLFENPYYAGGGYNVNIEDEDGETITIRVWDSTGIDISDLEQGVPIIANGVVSAYNNYSQILPGYQEDIHIDITMPIIEDISTSPQNPFFDEEISVTANVFDYDGSIIEVLLFYGLESNEDFMETEMNSIGNDNYETTIPALNTLTSEEDNFLIQIQATDDSLNVVTSAIMLIEISERAPLISNMQIINDPEPNDTLQISVNIEDTDGHIVEAQLLYKLNYYDKIYYADLEQDLADSTLFFGLIPGKSAGVTVNIGAYAMDDSSLVTLEYDLASYTYPVKTHKAILKVPPKPFDPYAGEKITIDFYSKEDDKAILRIYNAEGKLMFTPQNIIIANQNGLNQYEWDGRDKYQNLLPIGLYICYLEVINADTGSKKTAKAPIVIGVPLK